ncbi:hypothetical protein [Dialister succinatiphilus]
MVEETLFLPGFTGPESAVFPGRKQNFYMQTLALGHLRPCSDDEDRGLL